MKELHPLKRRKNEGTLYKIEWENGSWFLALPGRTSSQHPHGYFNDESAQLAVVRP